MKHTPGPWRIEDEVSGCKTILADIQPDQASGLDDEVFHCHREIGYTPGLSDESEDLANARLIASAPAMLESMKNVRFVINSDPLLHYLRSEPWFKKVDALINSIEEA